MLTMHPFNEKLAAAAKKRRARILRMSDKGMKPKDIAQQLGISRQRVEYMLKKAREETLV